MTASEYYDYVEYLSSTQRKTVHNVLAIIADNVNANRAFGRFFGRYFVEIHSHRYSVTDVLNYYHVIIDIVQFLMEQLSFQISAVR